MLQKSYVEGLRALVCYTATWQDKAKVAEAEGNADAAKTAHRVNDLLLPLVKGCGSERAYELLGHESLQTFGGSGYLQDYPLEQYVRDAKIDTLYEGTTAIQSLDLLFRKIAKDRGRALGVVAAEVQEYIESADETNEPGALKDARLALGAALGDVSQMIGTVTTYMAGGMEDPKQLYKVGLNSRRVLLALGDVLVAWLLQKQAVVALAALSGEVSESDRAFYRGKVAAAQFFAREVLPRVRADRKVVESADLDLMELPEAAF
jgi:hypothetical protein